VAPVGVARRDIHVAHDRAQQAQVEQHAGLEEKALRDRRRREERNERRVDRRVAVGRIEDAPVARRELRHEGEPGVPEPSTARHRAQLALVQETVSLRVVGFAKDDRSDELQQVVGIHLTVGVHLRDDLGAELDRALVGGHHRATHALVRLVGDELDSRIAGPPHHVGGLVRAPVVDDDDVPHERRNARDHVLDRARRAISGNDDRDRGELDRERLRECARADEEELRAAHGPERPHRVGVGLACRTGVAEGLGATSFGSRRCAVASSVCASAVCPS